MLTTRLPLCSILILVSALFAGRADVVCAQNGPRITGTYTNMYFNQEGGDVLGEEIKIVLTQKGYQGALQFSEGEPGELITVDIKVVGNKVSFVIPDTSSYAGQFIGTLENGLVTGEFHFQSGGSKKSELRKGRSYWE